MKKIVLFNCMLFFLLGIAGIPISDAQTIDFEGFDLGRGSHLDVADTLIFPDVSGSGVDVTIAGGSDMRICDVGVYGGNALLDQDPIGWPSLLGSMHNGTTISFSMPVYDFSLSAGDFGNDNDISLMISAFDSADNPLGTSSVDWDANATAPFATLSINLSGIKKVVYTSGGPYANSTFIDNITFTPVPVPSTILLLSTGLVGLVGFGRKKIKK